MKDNSNSIFPINVNYHNAHIDGFEKKESKVEILDHKKGIVKLYDAFIDMPRDVIIKFRPKGINILEYDSVSKKHTSDIDANKLQFVLKDFYNSKDDKYAEDNSLDKYNESVKYNTVLEIDSNSEIVSIQYNVFRQYYSNCSNKTFNDNPYVYNEKLAYHIKGSNVFHNPMKMSNEVATQDYCLRDNSNNNKPFFDFGMIIYQDGSVPRLLSLLNDNLANLVNLQKGLINIKVFKCDNEGYNMILPPEMLKDLLIEHEKTMEQKARENGPINEFIRDALLDHTRQFEIVKYDLDSIKKDITNIQDSVSKIHELSSFNCMEAIKNNAYNISIEETKYLQNIDHSFVYNAEIEHIAIFNVAKSLIGEMLDSIEYANYDEI